MPARFTAATSSAPMAARNSGCSLEVTATRLSISRTVASRASRFDPDAVSTYDSPPFSTSPFSSSELRGISLCAPHRASTRLDKAGIR